MSPRTVPSVVVHQDGGGKYATNAQKIRARNNITIGTWNVRTLRSSGKLKELMHKMNRYRWAVLGLCEVHWKNIGKTTTEEGHTLYFSGEEDKHLNDVGFLIHKDIMNTIMGCRPISSRLITSHLRAARFNITIIQAYAPTSDYDDQAVDDFYDQIQEVIDQTPKERYSHCAGGLECKGRKGCLQELKRNMWKILQHRIK